MGQVETDKEKESKDAAKEEAKKGGNSICKLSTMVVKIGISPKIVWVLKNRKIVKSHQKQNSIIIKKNN